jgi:hypothetical protein
MRNVFFALLIVSGFGSAVLANDDLWRHRAFSGVYMIYGGGLGDPIAPSPKDRKVMFSISGRVAKDLFNAIGPDRHDVCTEGSGTRVRWRDNQNLSCIRSEKGEYGCNFGFDLRSGKSIGGSIC